MAREKRICKGMSRLKHRPCRNEAVPGSDYCKFHGGGSVGGPGGKGRPKGSPKPPGAGGPPPQGNTNGIKHGAYSSRLPPDERPIYEELLAQYLQDVPNPSVTDRRALERLAILETKWQVAVTAGAPPDALDVLHRLLHRELKALQVTRESKDTARTSGTTPAEVVASLLMKIRERQGMLPPPRTEPVDADVIDAEVVEVADRGDSEED
jgi:hypothetical protein